MTFKAYSNRPTAVRGLTRYLGTANTDALALNSLITQQDGKYGFDTDAADAAVGLKGVSEEDEALILACGHATCPNCGVHLSNGLMDFDTAADRDGSEKEAFKTIKHEWQCMSCNHEWGKPIELKSAAKPSKTGRKYPNRNHSDVESPSELVFALADADPAAKRKDIVERAIAKGVTPNTARAAYQHWRVARGLTKAGKPA